MERTQIAVFCFGAIQQRHLVLAETYLAEDFLFDGPTAKPIGRQEWLDQQRSLLQAFPDLDFNLHDIHEHDGVVSARMRLSGRHAGVLLLPGMPPVPPTGRSVVLPPEEIMVGFKGDKIVHLEVKQVPNGGLTGILEQVGAFDRHASQSGASRSMWT